jgi:hypothetical protein
VREIYNMGLWFPSLSPENRALDNVYVLHQRGRYWPRWEEPKPSAGQWGHVQPLEPSDVNGDDPSG